MITDHISNASLYFGLGERIQTALKYLSETDFSKVEAGKYILDSDNIYAMVQEYSTKPLEVCAMEAHKKYIDVQFMAEGEEYIGYEPFSNQEISVQYDEPNDYSLFYSNPNLIKYTKGMFAILYPQDLHMPRVLSVNSLPVRKVVIKVKVE